MRQGGLAWIACPQTYDIPLCNKRASVLKKVSHIVQSVLNDLCDYIICWLLRTENRRKSNITGFLIIIIQSNCIRMDCSGKLRSSEVQHQTIVLPAAVLCNHTAGLYKDLHMHSFSEHKYVIYVVHVQMCEVCCVQISSITCLSEQLCVSFVTIGVTQLKEDWLCSYFCS